MHSGIYKIEASDGRSYIGSSKNIPHRWKIHLRLLNKNLHHSQYLQNAWNKYGSASFTFTVLEDCEQSELLTREQFYIDTYNPEFNICKIAGSKEGTTTAAQIKEKISRSLKLYTKTPEHKQNLSRSRGHRNFRRGKLHKQETKERIGLANSKYYELISPSGEKVLVQNLTKFCRENNLSRGNLASVVIGRRVQSQGWRLCMEELVCH